VDGTDSTATLVLPDVAAGDYVLTATNQAGAAQQGLTFLQGPAGPDLTADEIISRINGGTTSLAFARLPVGTSLGTVAEGQHQHGPADLTGSLDMSHIDLGRTSPRPALRPGSGPRPAPAPRRTPA
jgi:hypothetical protein